MLLEEDPHDLKSGPREGAGATAKQWMIDHYNCGRNGHIEFNIT